MSASAFHAHRDEWIAREEAAEALIPLIGGLYRDHGVVTSIHGHRLINLSATGVIAVHDRARARARRADARRERRGPRGAA